jgi:hypothetical protein
VIRRVTPRLNQRATERVSPCLCVIRRVTERARGPLLALVGLPRLPRLSWLPRLLRLFRLAALVWLAALPALVGLACVAACGSPATPKNVASLEAGVTLSLYKSGDSSYAIVDDRRNVEVSGRTLVLDNIEPTASLASLVIEPAGGALRIGSCTRERLPELPSDPLDAYAEREEHLARERLHRRLVRASPHERRVGEPPAPAPPPRAPETAGTFAPVVRCAVDGPPGRHLVRVVYVSPALAYRTQHDITMRAAGRATIESRFAIETPRWHTTASATVFDGMPGGEQVPRQLVRGEITLDGGTSVLVAPPREVDAHLRRIFIATSETVAIELEWARSRLDVWAMLELPTTTLPAGPVHVELDLPDEGSLTAEVPARRREATRDPQQPLRLPLFVDDALHGSRKSQIADNDGTRIVEVFMASVSNTGEVAREVWIENTLSPGKRRVIERAWPRPPSGSGNVVRNKLTVAPGKTGSVGYTVIVEQ